MKKTLICILLVACSIVFSGCGAYAGETRVDGTFTVVKVLNSYMNIVVDPQGYLYYMDMHRLAPIFDEDGKPMKYVKGNI